jgi:alpha-amylase/alpha-mannosidase (GH57 family)
MAHIVLHGHTYQPPRENPFTGLVVNEPTAAPFHDWNERITEECYRPMAWARVTDERNRVVDIVNVFSLMSFDLGPTLAKWLATHAPDVHDRIVAGDRAGGTAISHPYHHVIFPLADDRDRRTELAWGNADFRHRFDREPDGVWLPETAVDEASLVSIAEAGFRFVPLLSEQVRGGRSGTAVAWRNPADGRVVDLVLADSGLSREAAFGVFGGVSQRFIDRGLASAGDTGLGLAITDTETFGHHHKFSERTIAYALSRLVEQHGASTGSIGSWLDRAPREQVAKDDVLVSAWSCAHGVGRWWRDCGCQNGDVGGTQGWRTPLRAALDVVRRSARQTFVGLGSEVFNDPWAVRDAYGSVLAEPDRFDDIVGPHVVSGQSLATARLLLESQRDALAMYTSCAWFFDDISRIEPILVLRHAARCLDLLEQAGATVPRNEVIGVLATAVSNDPSVGTGADVWRRSVDSARVGATTEAAPRRATSRVAAVEAVRLAIATGNEFDVDAASRRLRDDATTSTRERAQELLFEALRDRGPEHRLKGLGEQVGLAVELIERRTITAGR